MSRARGGTNIKKQSKKITKPTRPNQSTNPFEPFKFEYKWTNDMLPNPFENDKYGLNPPNEQERMAINVSHSIRHKTKWFDKVNNKTITKKWREEAIDQGLDEDQFDTLLDELKDLVNKHEHGIVSSPIDGAWQADDIIDADVKDVLLTAAEEMENVPDKDKDWHPGSNKQVLDLVHPSLYCFVNGITPATADAIPLGQAITSIGEGLPLEVKRQPTGMFQRHDYSLSNDYQWLPSEFNIDRNGKVEIASYINNLNPNKFKKLYTAIEGIFEKFVPMFDRVLKGLEEYSTNNKKVNIYGRQVQVIVKMANIILTPQKPKYNGGSWHVEGMKNEGIVSTGIYYYQQENISESHLEFRQAVNAEPDEEEIEEFEYQENMAQESNDGGTVYFEKSFPPQDLGHIVTQEDRCIAFPNLYQHHVKSFELKDKTKPGVRKILVFFLIDPTQKTLSTSHIPPQQESWFEDQDAPETDLMSLKEAKKYREKLMEERKYFINKNDDQFFNRYVEREITLCEH